MEWFITLKTWFLSLGEQYNVNPIIFGTIYVGAIPFFGISLTWLIRSMKAKKSIVLPLLSTGFFFISAYLYLIIVGKNIPVWVYLFIGAMVLYGIYSTVTKIEGKVKE